VFIKYGTRYTRLSNSCVSRADPPHSHEDELASPQDTPIGAGTDRHWHT